MQHCYQQTTVYKALTDASTGCKSYPKQLNASFLTYKKDTYMAN